MFLTTQLSYSQDIHFTQNASLTQINPAMTGMISGGYDYRLVATYRNQWASVMGDGKYETTLLAYDHRFFSADEDFWAVGGTVSHDKAGSLDFKHIAGNLSASYIKFLYGHKSVRHYLSAGGQSGIAQLRFDPTLGNWGQQFTGEGYDRTLSSGEPFGNAPSVSKTYGDLSCGIAYHYLNDKRPPAEARLPYVSVGFAFHHLGGWIKTKYYNTSIFDKNIFIQPKWTVHATTLINLNSAIYVMPALVYSRQNNINELNVGLFVRTDFSRSLYPDLNLLQIGAMLRFDTYYNIDAIAPMIRLDIGSLTGGISYDLNISSLTPASQIRGGFEFSLAYRDFMRTKNGKLRGRQKVICRF